MYVKHALEYGSDDSDSNESLKSNEVIENLNQSKENSKRTLNHYFFYAFLLITSLVVLVNFFSYNSPLNTFNQSHTELNGITVVVSNEYGTLSTVAFPYPWLEGNLFAETYKTNTFTIQSTTEGCIYNWAISGVSSQLNDYYSEGSSDDGVFTFTPTITGEYGISISEYCDNSLTRSYESSLFSKYVRRELSALTDSDREAFLDAFATLWKVKTPEGQELYGENYKSVWHFAIIHNDAGASPICDEFHTGSGFINNHMYLGQYLEQSLRLVNPKVSLHYMEYANYFSSDDFYNKHIMSNMMDGGNWTEIFTSKWFGSNNPYTGKIIDGRWADIELPYLTDEFILSEGIDPDVTLFSTEDNEWLKLSNAHLKSPYGLLRSPWNWNPAPYTVRYNNVNRFNSYKYYNDISVIDASSYLGYYSGVVCDDYSYFMENNVNGLPLYNFLTAIEDDVHGKVHFTIGGSGGDHVVATSKLIQDKFGFDELDMVCIAQSTQKYFKSMGDLQPGWSTSNTVPFPLDCSDTPWQNGVLTTTAAPGEDGGPSCTCNSFYTSSSDNLAILFDAYFLDWNAGQSQYKTMQKLYNLTFSDQVEFANLLCGQFQYDGDMAGSGAAHDPVFWVVHGGVERLMQKIYFEGTLSDYTYFNGIQRNTCSGHTEDGVKDWLKGYYFEDKTILTETLSNTQLADYLNPLSELFRDNVNFVYDHSDWTTTMCNGQASEWFESSNFL